MQFFAAADDAGDLPLQFAGGAAGGDGVDASRWASSVWSRDTRSLATGTLLRMAPSTREAVLVKAGICRLVAGSVAGGTERPGKYRGFLGWNPGKPGNGAFAYCNRNAMLLEIPLTHLRKG